MFIDAQKMHEEHPDTFTVFHMEDLQAMVEPGCYVKVCHEDPAERFWVLVDEVNGDKVTGRVANELLLVPLMFNEVIEFELRHIYDYAPVSEAIDHIPDLKENIEKNIGFVSEEENRFLEERKD